STDDGSSWLKVADIPDGYTGTNPIGIRGIVFDPAVKSAGKSSTIYVGVLETGIYKSDDGGDSFALMIGSPKHPNRMQVVNQELFVTYTKGIALCSKGQWKDIAPTNDQNKNDVALAVDESDDNKIVVPQRYGTVYNTIYRSAEKGETWQQINSSSKLHVTVSFWNKKSF